MRVSLNLTDYSSPDDPGGLRGQLGRVVRAADEAGVDTVWVTDHLLQADPDSVPDAEMLEAYTTLGYVAALTERVRLGAMVTGVTFRPPAVLIKERPVGQPLPVRRPHPPILIGGMGERRTLRLVAAYGDACNLFDVPDGGKTVRHKLEVLARHCEEVGRPDTDVEKTISTRLGPDEAPEAFVERCAALAELGIEHAVVLASGPWTEEGVARIAAAVPGLRKIEPAAG